MKPIMWSFGMQSRAIFHIGEKPDIEGVVKTAADAGVKNAVIFGKTHTGLCFHPTKYGKGAVCFLNCGRMEDYTNSYLPAQRNRGKNLLQKIGPAPQAYLEHKNGSVELVSYEDKAKGEKVFTLVNHGGREGSLRTLFVGEQIADPQPAYKLELMIKSDAYLVVKDGNTELQTVREGKYIAVPIVMDSTWKFIKAKTKRK